MRARMWVPLPGALSISSVPPERAVRSRVERSPMWAGKSPEEISRDEGGYVFTGPDLAREGPGAWPLECA